MWIGSHSGQLLVTLLAAGHPIELHLSGGIHFGMAAPLSTDIHWYTKGHPDLKDVAGVGSSPTAPHPGLLTTRGLSLSSRPPSADPRSPRDRIATALAALNPDPLRQPQDASADFKVAESVLYNPYASHSDRARALDLWLQRHQPCLFGKAAAVRERIHHCILTDSDLARGEDRVRSRIVTDARWWKRRALAPTESGFPIVHSFLLHVASQRVAYASPDNALMTFALLDP